MAYRLEARTLHSVPHTAAMDRVEPVYEDLPGWRCSTQGARLKSSHQRTTTKPHPSPPKIATIKAPGAIMGRANQRNHWSATAATPGQSRSGFLTVDSGGGEEVMVDYTLAPHGWAWDGGREKQPRSQAPSASWSATPR